MSTTLPEVTLLMLADTCLLWGHRLSEWCGHGPALEEDIALTNTALDAIGQARALLQLVASRRDPPVTEDALAYFRDASDFHSLAIAEAENSDYAHTVLRSLLLAGWLLRVWQSLSTSADAQVASIAESAAKEALMQWRHAREWVIRFGDGTAESRERIERAVTALRPLCGEMLATGVEGTDLAKRQAQWQQDIADVFAAATLATPAWLAAGAAPQPPTVAVPSREPRRVLLAEMQSLARQHVGARW